MCRKVGKVASAWQNDSVYRIDSQRLIGLGDDRLVDVIQDLGGMLELVVFLLIHPDINPSGNPVTVLNSRNAQTAFSDSVLVTDQR